MDKDKIKNLALLLLAIALISMTIAYAVVAQRLDIKSNTTVTSSTWNIKFANLQRTSLVGHATEVTTPTLTDTLIRNINLNLKTPGDSVTYTFDIVNSGDIEAIIDNYRLTPGLVCTDSSNSTTSTDAVNVCNNMVYSLKYTNATQSGVPAGSDVALGQILKAGETVNVTMTIKFSSNSTYVPTSDVKVSGLDSYIIYVQN